MSQLCLLSCFPALSLVDGHSEQFSWNLMWLLPMTMRLCSTYINLRINGSMPSIAPLPALHGPLPPLMDGLDAAICHLSYIHLHLLCYIEGVHFWYSREIYRSKLYPRSSSWLGPLINILPTPSPNACMYGHVEPFTLRRAAFRLTTSAVEMLALCEPPGLL